jgi:hypothetical protein
MRTLKAPVAEHAISLMRERYADFGPTLAAEKLRTRHNVILAGDGTAIANSRWSVDPEDDACAEGIAATSSARTRRPQKDALSGHTRPCRTGWSKSSDYRRSPPSKPLTQ